MEKYSALIVVEGKTDKDLIESFLDADIVTTNGSEVSRETIDFVKEAAKKRPVVVLTDPDAPGKRIRDILSENVPGLLHAFVPKEKAIKHHKVGVAESNKETILEALANLVPSTPRPDSDLTSADLYELGLFGGENSVVRRHTLELALHLGHTNGKSLLQRCRALGLSKQDLEDAVHGRK
jgi:ribonuclease M5